MPRLDNCPLNFLQQVVQGKKRLFQQSSIKRIEAKKWPEFSIKEIWPHALTNESFLIHMPDGWTIEEGGRMPEKDYVWGVVCTLEYDWVSDNLNRIRAARHAHRQNTVVTKAPDIVLSDFWK